jgi:hypothetical protein
MLENFTTPPDKIVNGSRSVTLLLVFFFLLLFRPPLYAAASTTSPKNFITAGIGIEELTYREQVPEVGPTSSDSDPYNLVLLLEGRMAGDHLFGGISANLPLAVNEAREYWTRAGELEQTNDLAYSLTRVNIHAGLFLHPLFNPYGGIAWNYAKQERSNLDHISEPAVITATFTEKTSSYSALVGIMGTVPLGTRWSFSYRAEYQLPFSSETTNNALPGWKPTDIGGYGYTFTGRLQYMFSPLFSGGLQVVAGRQHWDGSDWIAVGDSRAKWPENDTDFLSGFLLVTRSF